MEYRNSSGTHFSGDFTVRVGSSHGVELTGGSTGGTIRPASDDASAALNIRAKGPSGILNLGTSTQGPTVIDGSSVALGSTHVSITSTRVQVSTALQIGTNPSSVGALRLGYDQAIHGRTSTDGNTMQIAKTSTGDVVYFGDEAYPTNVRGSSIAVGSTHLNLNSTRVSLGGGASTTAISGLMRVRVDFTVPEIPANDAVLGSTFTAVGLTTNAVTFFNTDALAAVLPHTVDISVRCSTTDEGRLVFRNIAASTIGTGLSTTHGYLGWFTF